MKLFLNLSKEEQRSRFLRRIDLPDHNWKFSAADVAGARALGRLPAGVLARCSRTPARSWAPWYVIPADRKWFARIAAAAVIAHTLIEIDPQYPDVDASSTRQALLTAKARARGAGAEGRRARPVRGRAARRSREEEQDAQDAEMAAAELEPDRRRT